MSKTLDTKLNSLSKTRRKKILAKAETLIQEELNLQEIRRLRHKTQNELAELLQKRQDEISRLERREDCLVSTLNDYVEALGGHLKLIVEFDDSPPIIVKPSRPSKKRTNVSSN